MDESIRLFLEYASSWFSMTLSHLDDFIEFGSQLVARWNEESKFVYPLFLSLLAAAIFWVVFNFLPFSIKWRKYRPIAEYDIWQVELKTSLVLAEFLQMVPHRPTVFQNKFRSGTVTETQIRIIIQNKCLSDAWLYDADVPGELISIGHDMRRKALEAERLIDKTLVLQEYIKSKEMILLEKTRQCLKRFQVEEQLIDNPYTKIGRRNLAPLVNNLDSFNMAVYDLYKILHEIRGILFRYTGLEVEQQFRVTKALHLYYTDQFGRFVKFYRKLRRKYKFKSFYHLYIVAMIRRMSLYPPIVLFEDYLEGKDRPTHFDRSLLQLYKESDDFRLMLENNYPAEDIQHQMAADESERNLERHFLMNNLSIYNYFRTKDTRMPEQRWDELEKLLR